MSCAEMEERIDKMEERDDERWWRWMRRYEWLNWNKLERVRNGVFTWWQRCIPTICGTLAVCSILYVFSVLCTAKPRRNYLLHLSLCLCMQDLCSPCACRTSFSLSDSSITKPTLYS